MILALIFYDLDTILKSVSDESRKGRHLRVSPEICNYSP